MAKSVLYVKLAINQMIIQKNVPAKSIIVYNVKLMMGINVVLVKLITFFIIIYANVRQKIVYNVNKITEFNAKYAKRTIHQTLQQKNAYAT